LLKNNAANDDDNEATISFKTTQNLFFVSPKHGPNTSECLQITLLNRYKIEQRKELLQCKDAKFSVTLRTIAPKTPFVSNVVVPTCAQALNVCTSTAVLVMSRKTIAALSEQKKLQNQSQGLGCQLTTMPHPLNVLQAD